MPTAQETQQIRAVLRGLNMATEDVVRRITLEVHANLVETTPVDTGWARANWVPRVGSPTTDPVGTPGAQGVGAASAASQAGLAGVLNYRLSQGVVWITNNVSYISALNDGHSRQQPAAFVQRAIRKALDTL